MLFPDREIKYESLLGNNTQGENILTLNLTICVRSCFIIQPANIDRSVRTTMQAIAECGRAKHVLAIDW